MVEIRLGAHVEGGVVADFSVCGTVLGGNTDRTANKKKISVLVTSVWGPDFNIRHPEKEEEIWPH